MALVDKIIMPQTNQSPSASLQDSHGRVIRKLRVSLLDACNLRCGYCMPLQMKFANSFSIEHCIKSSNLIDIHLIYLDDLGNFSHGTQW